MSETWLDNRMAVKRLAAAMGDKLDLKSGEGRGGWSDKDQCSREELSRMLREHVEKGDPVDVANFCMMLFNRGESISPPSAQYADTAAIALGAAVLTRIEDPAVRQIAIRNALTAALQGHAPSPEKKLVGPADQIIGQIEELFPNWKSYRDLVDCITCELHELRKRAEGRL